MRRNWVAEWHKLVCTVFVSSNIMSFISDIIHLEGKGLRTCCRPPSRVDPMIMS